MAKEELIQFEGLVTEILPDARYRVQLDTGHEIVAYTAGKMKKNRIKTLAGDRVTVEMSPYDLEKGRLIFRHKDERPGGPPRSGPPRGHSAVAKANCLTTRRFADRQSAPQPPTSGTSAAQKIAHARIVLGTGFA